MDIEAVMEIQTKYSIEEERFLKGHKFAMMIVDGVRANTAYAEAFEVPFSRAKGLSAQLYRAKWIQEIISIVNVDIELRDREHLEEIKEQMSIVLEDSDSEIDLKDKIAAARLLKDTIQAQQKPIADVEKAVDTRLADILSTLSEKAKEKEIEVMVIE